MTRTTSIISSCVGNIIEWYDFGLFTIFSALFSKLFFPTSNPQLGFITTLSIFSIGFLCRPIGGLIFGYIGDRMGRAKTLRWSILMISIPTFLIGFLPSYEQIGIAAPLLLLLVRMWQGISIGGEYSGNIIYLAETAPRTRRALITTFASMGANLGILLAACVGILCGYIFDESALEDYGWRLPYILSGILSLVVYFTRLKLQETRIYTNLKIHKQIARNPITLVFEKNAKELLLTLGLVCMGCTFYYFLFIYIPLYLTETQNLPTTLITKFMSILIILMIIISPIGALLCDRFGRRKMLLFNSALVALSILPGFYFLHYGDLTLIACILILFTIASAFEQSTTPVAIVENFPAKTRYTGISLGYNIGNGFLGGTVPLICQWLLVITNFYLAPALYITACAIISGLVVFIFIPETVGKKLN